jgi:beta-1,4-mannosyltransferase
MKIFFAPVYIENPYQKKLMGELSKLGIEISIANTGAGAFFKTESINEADIIHFHWFEPFVKSSSFLKSLIKIIVFLTRLSLFKKQKKMVWTVHNLVNHEKKNIFLDKLFLFFFTKMIDVFCVHNEYSKQQLLKQYPIATNKIKVISHGNYVNDYSKFNGDINLFREKTIGVDASKIIFTFLGNIRPYKGVLDLIEAFKILEDKNNCQLLICGHVTFKEDEILIKKAIQGTKGIMFKPGYVPNEDIEGYIKSSDVMIYPYKDILTSGALILGMSMAKPCLVSNVGSMTELISKEFVFGNVLELKDLMHFFQDSSQENLKQIGNGNYLKIAHHTWENMAKELQIIYNKNILFDDIQ